ncbi:hypothetical protein BWQ96_06160 [Gracilariopsis chorda]|uniref:Brl1/Brr6 domain-containing protein n=1 Tax=Gracilariopsis chorda TaxID=448386 RepID=A0A2V3IPU5_9FLOR|nr:hypothetical protein BWQ96_06160 [Gracilariopsis chorda]|eukprot:PXF44079.1 hypothetical protein BWQ96_06160 [Gracilariopsis chorda]
MRRPSRRAASPAPSSSTIHIDLTRSPAASTADSASTAATPTRTRSHHHHHHRHHTACSTPSTALDPRFANAYRLVHTHRERIYTPNALLERVRLTEQAPPISPFISRLSALVYLLMSVAFAAVLIHLCHALYSDIARKTLIRAHSLQTEASQCRVQFRTNDCETAQSPALRRLCMEWRLCSQRGDSALRHAFSLSVFAETIADMFNAFAATISSTGVLVALVVAALTLLFATFAFRAMLAFKRSSQPLPHVFRDDAQSVPQPYLRSLPTTPVGKEKARITSRRAPLVTWKAIDVDRDCPT